MTMNMKIGMYTNDIKIPKNIYFKLPSLILFVIKELIKYTSKICGIKSNTIFKGGKPV